MPRLPALVLAALMAAAIPVSSSPLFAEPAPAVTAPSSRITALSDTMQMTDVFAVMIEEGQDYGASIEDQMFPGQGGVRWSAMVTSIYDPAALRVIFDGAMEDGLGKDAGAIAAAEAFFGTPRGQTILRLEVQARRALLDKAVEEAAQVEAERMQTDHDPRMRLIRDLAEASDLIEMNVAGALSANLAFLQGMASVEVPGVVIDQESMMTEVWSQEADIRNETVLWLFPYLALAYGPLSDDDLKAYLDFAQSPEGKRLNGAVFAAFDKVFAHVSFELGRSGALIMQGSDI